MVHSKRNGLLPLRKSGDEVQKQRKEIVARLEEFRGLTFNWDGYQAKAVADATLEFSKETAFKLINRGFQIDFCVPLRDGGVQFEFKHAGRECELEIHPDKEIVLLVYSKNNEILEKKHLKSEQLEALSEIA